ncbi:hypothetical protein [Legionella longbeachae]|uniref:hypothetical protein n=1 Tax=Legionella longbeachae TaxID=450 RepID=UPI001404A172|nr:hypothetical protein [Legionella longbeachae]QIN30663.1 hypothetical protein GCB94_00190 [Legionella longbeachae]
MIDNLISITNPTWPQLTLILVLVFIFVFRSNISELLDRTKEIGRSGLILGPKQNPPPLTIVEQLDKSQRILEGVTSFPTVRDNLKIIDQNIASKSTDDPNKIINDLKNDLADAFFILRCERVYYIIFGSQIRLLKKLQIAIPAGLNQIEINSYIEDLKKSIKEIGNFDTNQYMFFLLQAGLVLIVEDVYKITEYGVDFLTWLQRSGYSENKLY